MSRNHDLSKVGYALSAFRMACTELMEPLVRLLGIFGACLGKDREGVELVVRGRILGGAAGWKVGRNVRFIGPSIRYHIGARVIFYGNAYLNANGPDGCVTIGDDSHIDQFCVLYGQGGLDIGKCCAIASGVLVYTQSNADALKDGTPVSCQPTVYAPVSIGDGCWLGAGVRLLPGVALGRNVHVGAGAVVIRDVADGLIVVGVPARPLDQSRPL